MNDNAGRHDYDQLVRFRQIQPGEPYFLIRGQDAVAGDAVRAWASLARTAGAPSAIVEQALQQADRLDAWPTKKTPDADHLTDAEQKQLAYALSRRAWHAREDSADVKVMLAEERAISAALGRLRPLLNDLLENGAWNDEGDFVYRRRRRTDGSVIEDFDPITGLHRFVATLGRDLPPSPREAIEAFLASPAVEQILSLMNFHTGPIAFMHRDAGAEIPPKVEAEQAFTMRWLLRLALEHGDNWREVAADQVNAMRIELHGKAAASSDAAAAAV
ncbi:hypothetical protein [Caulobacter sp. 1776]|uniref:hypothetical protein n=1 Tax=Caulobacter sp. 1776 TaxID=3156420 RepID=UPI003392D4CD